MGKEDVDLRLPFAARLGQTTLPAVALSDIESSSDLDAFRHVLTECPETNRAERDVPMGSATWLSLW
jgi:hypothetical protein